MNHYLKQIDLSYADQLQKDLPQQGFVMSRPQHTIFQAKKPGVTCTLYESGKLMVQGKGKDAFIEFYIEPLIGDFSFTHPEKSVNMKPHIGVDEAGKGDFFGPLVIASVYADEARIKYLLEERICDSKRLSDKAIVRLANKLRKLPYSIVKITPPKYNELYSSFGNLNTLLAWGHATAIEELHKKTQCQNILIDQFANEVVVESALAKKKLRLNLDQRHQGEEDPVVAAASILARDAFLHGIEALGKKVSMELPKGASKQVVAAGKRLVHQHGPNILKEVGKLHFRTRNEILQGELL